MNTVHDTLRKPELYARNSHRAAETRLILTTAAGLAMQGEYARAFGHLRRAAKRVRTVTRSLVSQRWIKVAQPPILYDWLEDIECECKALSYTAKNVHLDTLKQQFTRYHGDIAGALAVVEQALAAPPNTGSVRRKIPDNVVPFKPRKAEPPHA